MTELDMKSESKPEAAEAGQAAVGLGFPGPLLTAMPGFGMFARGGASQVQDQYGRMKAASDDIAAALRESYLAGARSAADCGFKLMEISGATTTSTVDFLTGLLKTRTPADVLALAADHARKSFDAASAQNAELWALSGKLANATTEPLRRTVAKALQHEA